MTENEILSHFSKVKRNGKGWTALCPAHEDHNPSLSITNDDGTWLLNCHAGCEFGAVVDAAGLREAFTVKTSTGPQIVAEYDYLDEDGKQLFQVVRQSPKGFRQRRKVNGEWVWSLGDTRRVPYRLPEIIAAVAAGTTVYIAEGEKDVEALRAAGAVATTNAGGAGKWRDEYSAALAGAPVIIIADKDEPGRKHAAAVAASVRSHAASVALVEAAAGKDAADHLRAGKTLQEFVPVADAEVDGKRPVRFYTVPELPEVQHAEIEWIVPDYVARTLITQFTGLPKEGKSTFLAALVAAVAAGREFIGRRTTKTRVLYFTEEGAATFLHLMRRVCAQDEDGITVLLRSEVFGLTWAEVCEILRDCCRKNDIGLLIVDTFTDLAGLAGEDENVSGPVLAALKQLRPIAADGTAVVIVRHDRKDGGNLIERGRGSGAFAGAVDILMGIRRRGETQREINAEGRIDGIPASLHVDFDGIEFAVAMHPKEQRDLAFERRVLAVLPRTESEAIGIDALVSKLDFSKPTARKMLKRLKDEGAVFAGRGKGRVSAAQAVGWWAP